MIREGQKGHSKFLFKPVGQGRRGISWGKKYSGYGEGSIKENQGKGHSSVAMEMWFQGAGTSIRWEIRETDSDSDMLLEEETGFNPKGNWNYQKALNTCSFILRDFPIAQVVKNLPATQKIRVRSLGWEDPLEKEMATHCSILAWRMPWTGSLAGYSPWGHKELDTTERLALAFILGAQQTKNFRVWWALSRK